MSETVINRRRSERTFEPGGTAICHMLNQSIRCGIRDASKTGVALGFSPEVQVGTPIELQLRWPSVGSASANGVICRRGLDAVAVQYVSQAGIEALIRDLLLIEDLRRNEPKPLLCGDTTVIRTAAEQLTSSGFAVCRARTPLDAIQLLLNPWEPITSVVFVSSPSWLELAALIGQEFASVQRVLLTEGGPSEDNKSLQGRYVDQTLCGPWHPSALYDALGLRFVDEPCLSCGGRVTHNAAPFCMECREWSRHFTPFDDLGCAG